MRWEGHLTQILPTQADRGGSVPDASHAAVDPGADPAYWAEKQTELAEATAVASSDPRPEVTKPPPGAPGIATESGARLTMTAEEAAMALAISRALAYETVSRNKIPVFASDAAS